MLYPQRASALEHVDDEIISNAINAYPIKLVDTHTQVSKGIGIVVIESYGKDLAVSLVEQLRRDAYCRLVAGTEILWQTSYAQK